MLNKTATAMVAALTLLTIVSVYATAISANACVPLSSHVASITCNANGTPNLDNAQRTTIANNADGTRTIIANGHTLIQH